MEQHMKERSNDSMVQQVMQRYGIANEQIRPIDAFEPLECITP